MVAATVGELRGGYVDDTLARTARYLMDKAHQVLVGVAESHASSDATLEERGRAREVEGDHTLILVPDVHHPVEFLVARPHAIDAQQVVPIVLQLGKGCVDLLGGVQPLYRGMGLFLIDDLRGRELLVGLVLDISQHEDQVFLLARLQFHLYIMRGDGTPAVGMAIARTAFDDGLRGIEAVVQAHKRLAVGIEALYLGVHMIEGIVVAALPVFGLMVDGRALYLHLAGREVALEVLHVGSGIPQAPLLQREQLQMLHLTTQVLQGEFLHLGPCLERNEEQHRCLYIVLPSRDARVAHAMTALIEVERRLAWLPTGRPDERRTES